MTKIICPECSGDEITHRHMLSNSTATQYECLDCDYVWHSWESQPSNKAKEFEAFSKEVINHIETYAVPQYGDYPNDLIKETTIEDIVHDMQRYLHRMKTNARGAKEVERDFLKLGHYACIAYYKLKEANNDE